MPQFTVFVHAFGTVGLARTLRAARIASDILVIHDGDPGVERLCLRYGARDKTQIPGVTLGAYAMDAFHPWLLLLHSGEELSDEVQQALAEWQRRKRDDTAGYLIRTNDDGPQLRFINRSMVNWIGEDPPIPTQAGIFPGAILRRGSQQVA